MTLDVLGPPTGAGALRPAARARPVSFGRRTVAARPLGPRADVASVRRFDPRPARARSASVYGPSLPGRSVRVRTLRRCPRGVVLSDSETQQSCPSYPRRWACPRRRESRLKLSEIQDERWLRVTGRPDKEHNEAMSTPIPHNCRSRWSHG